ADAGAPGCPSRRSRQKERGTLSRYQSATVHGFQWTVDGKLLTVSRHRATTCLAVVLSCAAILRADEALSKAEAARFQAKLTQIEKNAAPAPKRGAGARVTTVTDTEVNSYLKFLAG